MNQTEVLFVPISGEQASTSQLEAGHQVADWSTLCKFCCCCCFTFSLSHVSHSVSFVVFVLFPFSVSHQPSACSDSISIWVCIATHQTKLRIRQIDTLAEKWSIQLYIRVAVCVFLSVCLSAWHVRLSRGCSRILNTMTPVAYLCTSECLCWYIGYCWFW